MSPVFILVRPQLGENIGMAARAMLNCGVTALRLVAPRDGWPSASAVAAAAGADVVLDGARVFPDTAAAVADLHRVYATSARPRDMMTPVMPPRAAAAAMRTDAAAEMRCGVLFGGERSGLSNDDMARACATVRAPLNPTFRSLNLAQAVFMMAWEWRMAVGEAEEGGEERAGGPAEPPADAAMLDGLLARLDAGLAAGGFFRSPEMAPTVRRNLRVLFQRARPTAQEARTLHGAITALRRAGPE